MKSQLRASPHRRGSLIGTLRLSLALLALTMTTCLAERPVLVPKWTRFEQSFVSFKDYKNPIQSTTLEVVFTAPSGRQAMVYGFWDGGKEWKVRFLPDEVGIWSYKTSCSDRSNASLHGRSGSFTCTAPGRRHRFEQHGPVEVVPGEQHFSHKDGSAFFWLGDTAWNGPLLSSEEEWDYYVALRSQLKFSVVQFAATQWRAAPHGDRDGRLAFSGTAEIAVNPVFFRRLDEKIDQLNRAGLLAAPVLLWAHGGGSNKWINPGYALPEDQAILLARYMVARWGGNYVAWMLAGDGDYREERAERWRRIGRVVFGGIEHAPVMMHPGGTHWILDEFKKEDWFGVQTYQSGHGDNEAALKWLVHGPPAGDWMEKPLRPFLNLEPPYENHVAYNSRERITPFVTRRAVYWSLLLSPTAGVSYGGHGVWGWDDGSKLPTDHPGSGIPLPLPQALIMPGAMQMRWVAELFGSIDFAALRPSPEVLAAQPGDEEPRRHAAAARTASGNLLVVYLPEDRKISILKEYLTTSFTATWHNPRTGQTTEAAAAPEPKAWRFATPDDGDWLLMVKTAK